MKRHITILCFLAIAFFSCRKEQNPVSRFTHQAVPEPGDIQIGDTVWFNNMASGASRYYWDFGDGGTSTSSAKSVPHVFSIADWVRVTLIAYGSNSNSSNDEIFHVNSPAGHVSFWYSQSAYFRPTVVTINSITDTIKKATPYPSDCARFSDCANFKLTPGNYQYTAAELPPGHYTWSGIIHITQHGCATEQLR
jgi:hypothetical protein